MNEETSYSSTSLEKQSFKTISLTENILLFLLSDLLSFYKFPEHAMKPWRLVSDETAAPGRKEPLILKIFTIAPGQSITERRLLPTCGVRPSSVQ